MKRDWLDLMETGRADLPQELMETNRIISRFGLALTEEDAAWILEERKKVLREQRRVEFGRGIAPDLVFAFCDSDFVDPDTFAETIVRLQEIFYLFKNEMEDRVTDTELIEMMRDLFENTCYGDLDYLESTCLAEAAREMRMGRTKSRRGERE